MTDHNISQLHKPEPIDLLQQVLNLETAVGREKDVQALDVPGGFEKFVVTLLVMRSFSNFSGASRACADFRDPTAVSRIMVPAMFASGWCSLQMLFLSG